MSFFVSSFSALHHLIPPYNGISRAENIQRGLPALHIILTTLIYKFLHIITIILLELMVNSCYLQKNKNASRTTSEGSFL